MPELPDLTIYREALERRLVGARLEGLRWLSPFVLRTLAPPVERWRGAELVGVERLGKRLVLAVSGGLFAILHLRIAGRLHWRELGGKGIGRTAIAAFDVSHGTLWLVEAAKKKRASVHWADGRAELAAHDPGGLEPLTIDLAAFAERLRLENRTLKRALIDPTLFAGIGNAYSDEILHAARLSPTARTRALDESEIARLFAATGMTLRLWTERLRAEVGDGFPAKVTAFRPEMAVHGRFGEPCPVCASPVQRIVYAENEANYCARCQTGGRLLADRALSRLLHDDWPRTLDELEERRAASRPR